MVKPSSVSPLAQVLDQLWRAMHLPTDAFEVVGNIVDQALSFQQELDDSDPESARLTSRLSYLMAELASSSGDNAIIRKLLQELVEQGALGELLCASFIGSNKITGEKLRIALQALPANRLLAVTNRFLSAPRAAQPKEQAWATETVHELQSDDPEEALLFLDRLAQSGERPAFAVQREMLHGRFGFWLQELLRLDLDQEQARYMADTASRLDWAPLTGNILRLLKYAGPDDLPAIFDMVEPSWSDPGGRTAKAALLFLKHKEPQVRLAAARVLVRLGSPKASKVLAMIYAATPEARSGVLGVALMLGAQDFARFAKALPAKARPEVLGALLSCLARLDPVWLRNALKGIDGSIATAVAGLVKGRKRAVHKPRFKPQKPAPYRKAPDQPKSLLGKVKKMMGGESEAGPSAGQVFVGNLAPGAKIKSKIIKDVECPGKDLSKMAFQGCALGAMDLRQSKLAGTRFVKCRLNGVDLSAARFKNTVFEECDFAGCLFSGSSLDGVRLVRCSLTRTHFDGVLTSGLELMSCRFDESSFWGAHLEGATVRSCLFGRIDFSYAALVDADFDGVEFTDCVFRHLYASSSRVMNAAAWGCVFQACALPGVHGDEPGLLLEVERSAQALVAGVADREQPTAVSGKLAKAEGQTAMLSLVQNWLHERDLARNRRLALAANRRRLDWCAGKLGLEASKVLGMLPGLVQAGAIRDGDTSIPAPACIIQGWTPTYTALKNLEEYFGGIYPAPSPDEKPAPAILVEAFYSIGSVGTIAQTRNSDIDMWVCFDETRVEPDKVTGFKEKLEAIERWADREYGLELHFFVMDMGKVRENNFGFSDKESAGSSQALLLKEEFYRTAVLLGGKKLAWWLLPPDASDAAYAKGLERIASAASLPPDDVVDLGAMSRIPRDEFFGASLWQIVKALKSPFKSIMKFALLDKYIAGGNADTLLCNRLNRNIQAGRYDFWSVDPYGVMFSEVEAHYRNTANKDARELMQMAFEQKTGFSSQGRTTGRQAEMCGTSWLEYFYPYCADERSGLPKQGKPGEKGTRTFADLHELGQMVARYMFGTYEQIRKGVDDLDTEARITDQDLTKLGRKIFGHFDKKPGKIMHIPFVDSPKRLFESLEIVCEGQPGTPRIWLAKGEPAGVKSRKAPFEELHKDRSPVALLAWLVANHLYEVGEQFRGTNLQAPISTPDVRRLLDDLAEFFAPKQIFEPEIEETLRDEEVIHALVVVNFMTDREIREIRDVVLLYATNWGEVFCVTEPKGLDFLEKNVSTFIQANTKARIAPSLECRVHIPHKSLAPRPPAI
ncbi:class I adenylate cyclase [Desulfovibrio ferrophilus]|uniref:Putative adenylate cyclase n=1 Tax=Desulfovibrio ferrophilus TaxID=241368 RepID=A0A2Z6B0F9_9BACT|nr:class I adenylate cyclase [Desulfovibrio ferrophilus]BBD08991.1 putative adenylate cyclase [Desulfovibrio ferrophilus]